MTRSGPKRNLNTPLLCDAICARSVVGRAFPNEGLSICKDGDQNDRYDAGHKARLR